MRDVAVKTKLRPDVADPNSGELYSCYTGSGHDVSLQPLYPGDSVSVIENLNPLRKGDEGVVLGFSEDEESAVVDFGGEIGLRDLAPELLRKFRKPRSRR